jgi:putative transposase
MCLRSPDGYHGPVPTHLRRYDEPGHAHFLTVSCYRRLPFFGTAELRTTVVRCMADASRRLGFRWIGYVIMPEHVHWLCYPQVPRSEDVVPISAILQSLKTAIGMRAKQALREAWLRRRSLGHAALDRWATAESDHKPIWTTRGIDFNVASYERLIQKLDYCHKNPLTRGLVERPEDWIWSSQNHYEGGGTVLLAMDWDGGWPLE